MEYQYKVLVLNRHDEYLIKEHFNPLQREFDDGWEYVDSISQPMAGGQYSKFSIVAVILKKIKFGL